MKAEVKILIGTVILLAGVILLFVLELGIITLSLLWIGNILLAWGAIEITTA